MAHPRTQTARRRPLAWLVALLAVAAALLAACGGDDSSEGATSSSGNATAGTSSGELTPLTIGYSAWPGWFPLAVAEKAGIFTKAGLKVDLTYFVDYTASLDALVAGQLDVNAQTLNDTIFAVASGSSQKIVVVGDNSTGNDAVICDAKVSSIADLKGRTIAAETGVVDHFLLLQGLATVGLGEKDISFQGVKTDAAAAAFAGGQFDCVAVFAPFTLQALERPGSKVLFSSKEFPGTIPDHLVAGEKAAGDGAAMQKLVDAWYQTLRYIEQNPEESIAVMADKAQVSVEDYKSFADGTTLFDAKTSLNAFADRPGDPTSLPEMARRINPFLVSSGLTEKEADLSGLFEPQFTKSYVDAGEPS